MTLHDRQADAADATAFPEYRRLSSGLTFVFKLLFPLVWMAGFGFATVAEFLWPDRGTHNVVPGGALDGGKWIFLVALLFGSAFILRVAVPLKRVILDGDALLVSNYLRTVRVPLASVARVTQNRWINVRPVTVHLREPSPFGARFTFMPPRPRWVVAWREDAVVHDLRARVAAAAR